jgi:hypothetical protein
MNRISFEEVQATLAGVLEKLGFSRDRALGCARLFAETTRDGVYTHGINRFPRFVAMVRNGSVDVEGSPELVTRFGALERWDGRRGPGNLNARACMERAMQLSREHGLGCVSLGNTNHWMRGGSYGWQAAEAGLIGICWTNTQPNLPAWGGAEPCLGNNPLVIAVPREGGHVVLDMAMSQFSYGTLESYRMRGEMLPVDGGFNAEGNLTREPHDVVAAIHVDDFAGNGAGQVAGQVKRRAAHFALVHVAVQRRSLGMRFEHVAQCAHAARGQRLDGPGRNGVDADVLRSQLIRQVAHGRLQRGLGQRHHVVVRHHFFGGVVVSVMMLPPSVINGNAPRLTAISE